MRTFIIFKAQVCDKTVQTNIGGFLKCGYPGIPKSSSRHERTIEVLKSMVA